MKLNIISDIHATIINGKVRYTLPFRYSLAKYKKIFNTFFDYFNNNQDKLKNTIDYFNKSSTNNINNIVENINLYHLSDYKNKSCINLKIINEFDRFLKILSFDNVNWHYKIKLIAFPEMHYSQFLIKSYTDFNPEFLEPADYLIIAGDLGDNTNYDLIVKDLKKKTNKKFKDIYHIAGNHDYWNYEKCKENLKNHSIINTIDLTHSKFELIVDNYVFLGCTLWTDVPEKYKTNVQYYMNDYNRIPGCNVDTTVKLYHEYKQWLFDCVEKYKDKKVIIFTHHNPFKEMIPPKFNTKGENAINYAYSIMDDTFTNINKFNNIKLWACGHTHDYFNDIIHNIHCVRNPIGYSDLYNFSIPENYSNTWYNTIIEI